MAKDNPTAEQQAARDAAKRGAQEYGRKVADRVERENGRR